LKQHGKTREEIDATPGKDLDEFHSHRLLEWTKAALTVVEMREALRQIDVDKNSRMSLVEYLAWLYKVSPDEVVNSPQGDNSNVLQAAEEAFAKIDKAMQECQAALESNTKALEELKAAQVSLAAAEAELAAAVAELKRQEEEHKKKMEALEKKSQDETIGVVQRNKAANELDQMKAEDPLPLRRAKITQEAALRKVQKEQKIVAAKKADAEVKQKELEKSYDALQAEMKVAEQKLQEAREAPGVSFGSLWMMERELFEADARLPTRRQKYDHRKPFEWTPPK